MTQCSVLSGVVVIFPSKFLSSDGISVVLMFSALNCVEETERKLSECEKRTSSSADLKEPGGRSSQAPCQLPNKVRFSSNSKA